MATLAGSLLGGWSSDRLGREVVWLGGSAIAAIGLALFALLPVGSSVVFLVIFAILTGLGFGSRLPLLNTIAADVFDSPSFGRIYGSLQTSGAIGGALGPWLAGFLFDLLHSYTMILSMASGMLLISGSLVLVVRPGSHHHTDSSSGILQPGGNPINT